MSIQLNASSLLLGALVAICLAIVVQAQYNTFDSDSNSDSDGSPILTQTELGKLMRNSAKNQAHQNHQNLRHQQTAAATRNLYNRQQPLQYAPTNRRQYGGGLDGGLNGYGPVMGAASHGRGSNSDANDDDDGPAMGPNFGSNFDNSNDDSESSGANGDGPALNLNQAASGGYPSQGDYSGEGAGAGFGFGPSGYGAGADGGEFEGGFSGDGRRAKSASSPLGSRNFGSEDDAGAPQYGPNSAVNSGDNDDEGRGYSPEGQDNDNDDE